MTLPNWDAQFSPLASAGWGIREGQRQLGDAFITALNEGGNLIAEAMTGTGKSLVAAIPVIHAVQDARRNHRSFRAIISTETITLQNQIVNKDLPMLLQTYGNFSYKKLMGRGNYVCLNSAAQTTVGNSALSDLYTRLEAGKQRLGTGEREDVENALGRRLEAHEWELLVGSSDFCGPNECESDMCFGTLARHQAAVADIVVVNHAILATDVEMKTRTRSLDDSMGMLGEYNALIVDEGHRLVPVFTSQNTEKVNDWEIHALGDEIRNGAEVAQREGARGTVEDTAEAIEIMHQIIEMSIGYYNIGLPEWEGSEQPFSFRRFINPPQHQVDIINQYERNAPMMLDSVIGILETTIKTWKRIAEEKKMDKKMAKVRKGLLKAEKLLQLATIIRDSLLSKDAIVNNFGIYGVVIQGWRRRDNTMGASIFLEPLDISPKTKFLWDHADTSLLMSATLKDQTDSSPMRFIRASTGFPDCPEIFVRSPFDHAKQQLVYVTSGQYQADSTFVFSFEELYQIIMSVRGRCLVLFTARKDLDEVALKLRLRQSEGMFPYQLLVQDQESDKRWLAEEFKRDVNSVLLGTDSFMTGFDAPGETLSGVIMCKFPNPRYSVQMKQKVLYWRTRGFPAYYQREALEKFGQGAGRLIRSENCTGIFALLDQRVCNSNENTYKSAVMGINALGSPVTQNMEDIGRFV